MRHAATARVKSDSKQSDGRLHTSLVARGLAVQSVLDKNDIIEDMLKIWVKEDEILQKNRKSNEAKKEIYDEIKSKVDKFKFNINVLQRQTAFLNTWYSNQLPTTVDSLKREIQEIESEIDPKSDMEDPQLLNTYLTNKYEDSIKILQMKDLVAHRLEEQLYMLKKRMNVVEQSQHSANGMKNEYGSVQELVDCYQIYQTENEALKSNESSFKKDAITRRRHFDRCSDSVAAHLGVLLQTDYLRYTSMYQWLHPKTPPIYQGREKSFDEVAPDIRFMLNPGDYEEDDFAGIIDEENIKKVLTKSTTLEKKLESMKAILLQQILTVKNLTQQLEELRQIKHYTPKDKPTRYDKLWDINDRVFSEIGKSESSIDKMYEDAEKLCQQIFAMVHERNYYSRKWVLVYEHLVDLNIDHSFVTQLQSRNTEILGTLVNICHTFAIPKLLGVNDHPLAIYLQKLIKPLMPSMNSLLNIQTKIETPIPLNQMPKGKSTINLFDLFDKKKKKTKTKKRGNGTSRRSKNSQCDDMSIAESVYEQTYPPPFVITPHEYLYLLSKAINITDSSKSNFEYIEGRLRASSQYVQKWVHHALQEYTTEFTSDIHFIQNVSSPFLRIPKCEVESQTEPPPFQDMESQTLDVKSLREQQKTLKASPSKTKVTK